MRNPRWTQFFNGPSGRVRLAATEDARVLEDTCGIIGVDTPILENPMEKKMENQMETGTTGFIWGILGLYKGYIGILENKLETTLVDPKPRAM